MGTIGRGRAVEEQLAPPFRFGHFPQLDGFRGLAVLLVLVGHAMEFSGAKPEIIGNTGNSLAQLGVVLFLILSGFLISGLLWREKKTFGQIDLKAFYLRRALRLGPALGAFLTATYACTKIKLLTDIPNSEFAVCVLYLRNIFRRGPNNCPTFGPCLWRSSSIQSGHRR